MSNHGLILAHYSFSQFPDPRERNDEEDDLLEEDEEHGMEESMFPDEDAEEGFNWSLDD